MTTVKVSIQNLSNKSSFWIDQDSIGRGIQAINRNQNVYGLPVSDLPRAIQRTLSLMIPKDFGIKLGDILKYDGCLYYVHYVGAHIAAHEVSPLDAIERIEDGY